MDGGKWLRHTRARLRTRLSNVLSTSAYPMKPLLAPFLLFALLSACAPRERLNENCEWTNDPSLALDSRTLSGERHLANDAVIAEELAIRYADTQCGRRSGHFAGMN